MRALRGPARNVPSKTNNNAHPGQADNTASAVK
jgi:hypothetical protein